MRAQVGPLANDSKVEWRHVTAASCRSHLRCGVSHSGYGALRRGDRDGQRGGCRSGGQTRRRNRRRRAASACGRRGREQRSHDSSLRRNRARNFGERARIEDLGVGFSRRGRFGSVLLLLLFALLHRFAQRAHLAGEGFLSGGAQRHFLGVVAEHPGPSDDLCQIPLAARGDTPREQAEDDLDPSTHGLKSVHDLTSSKANDENLRLA